MSPAATARENVKVTVRLRPPNETELAKIDHNVWDVDFNQHKLSLEQNFAEKTRKQINEFFYGILHTLLYKNYYKSFITGKLNFNIM
jgi:hypothetical protein